MNFITISELIKNFPFSIRRKIFIKHGMRIGEGSVIGHGFTCDNPQNISIGKNSLVNYNSRFHCGSDANIKIGDNCQISFNVYIVCTSHKIGGGTSRAGERTMKSVFIGNGVWVGVNATILPGITIGDGCVIAAGAVVTSDCEPNCLYGGVPAKIIKRLD